jgi:tetratricopeptide (TPR) repeat protein
MKRTTTLTAGALFTLLAACGGGNKEPVTPTKGPDKPVAAEEVSKDAQAKFNAALDSFVEHDKANDWSDQVCADVAKQFDAAAALQGGKFAQATFNAGLAYQRCGDDKNAKAKFEQALRDDPKLHGARASLALYKYKQDQNEDAAINELQQAVVDAQFQNVPALVNLAMFQMQRESETGGQGCKNDMDCAKLNLQRALAIDDAFMPAFNQLALYYFQVAKKKAGGLKLSGKGARGRSVVTNAAMAKRADVQQLELAALVCSQAIKKNANYAPIHNTAGLIQNELGQVNGAVSEFATAAKLDPKFFEAQMNYAAVNLGFRGFEQARTAYEKALQMRPGDYDAHLGMALALRGPITGSEADYDQKVAAVQAELDAAKKITPERPDAYYNEGILTMEFKAKSGGDKEKVKASLRQAQTIFQTFLDKAAGKPEYDGAVKRVKGDGTDKDRGRLGDIDDTIKFLDLGIDDKSGGNNAPAPAATPDASGGAAGGAPAPAPAAPAPAPAEPAKK